jgi:hypothetical protein
VRAGRICLRVVLMLGLIAVTIAAVRGTSPTPAAADTPFAMGPAIKLPESDGGTEPRIAVGPDGTSWLITNRQGTAVVYSSTDTVHWTRTAGTIPGQVSPTIDTDIVVSRTGRIIANELDFAGPAIITAYSDDRGAHWTASGMAPGNTLLTGGTNGADQDRNWLAVGPDDPNTHQPRVYHLYHNLASGTLTHNMFVQTSTDNGANFGPPIPVTLPGDAAWLDLQCADSGGPSNITVNQVTGQVYAVFGTRSSVLGGCGSSVVGQFEINVVAATRVWVATTTPAKTATLGAWTQSLAVDNNPTGHIVGMQLAPGLLDNAGNIYVFYPDSPQPYPNYNGAALRYTYAPPDLSTWSKAVTLAPTGGAPGGHVLPHVIAGDPGRIDFAYFTGVPSGETSALWYMYVAQTTDGRDAAPAFATQKVSNTPTYQWTASEMMGSCGQGPANGFTCARSTDVWGIALRSDCSLQVSWPVESNGSSGRPPGAATTQGTYVSTQVSGPRVCNSVQFPPATFASPTPKPLPNTTRMPAPPAWVPVALLLVAGVSCGLLLVHRRW